ncbi:MAG TPA: diguanylate cyclase [Gemmatimonadales bacterium]|nr:diguanylate cyclase [Gemmatimonadales bacterium]
MLNRTLILYCASDGRPAPATLTGWGEGRGYPIVSLSGVAEVEQYLLRGSRAYVIVDAAGGSGPVREMIRRLKTDPYTAVAPLVLLLPRHDTAEITDYFDAGADEILTPLLDAAEQRARLDAMVIRSERSVAVHPSTRLPGTTEIERAIRRNLMGNEEFAVCYADLDHFKEFNDRYSYYDGDRVILMLSRILHDVVKGIAGSQGFVGHIGGDDFIFVLPQSFVHEVCTEIVHVFDQLIALQYNDQDRRSGYFFGKDRRGQLHRVPLMTLSIGIVTNKHRKFTHPAQLSELATEMKSYAKTLPGSVFVVDRRQPGEPEEKVPAPHATAEGTER